MFLLIVGAAVLLLVFLVMGAKLYDFQKRLTSMEGASESAAPQGQSIASINTAAAG